MSIRLLAFVLISTTAGIVPAHAANGRSVTGGRGAPPPGRITPRDSGRTVRPPRPPAPRPIPRVPTHVIERSVRGELAVLIQNQVGIGRPAPTIHEIRLERTTAGPNNTLQIRFSARVGRSWFTGGNISLQVQGRALVALTRPTFDNPFTQRNLQFGDNTLERVGG